MNPGIIRHALVIIFNFLFLKAFAQQEPTITINGTKYDLYSFYNKCKQERNDTTFNGIGINNGLCDNYDLDYINYRTGLRKFILGYIEHSEGKENESWIKEANALVHDYYLYQSNYYEAIELQKDAIEQIKKVCLEDISYLEDAYLNLMHLYVRITEYDEAIALGKILLDMPALQPDYRIEALLGISTCYSRKNEYHSAEQYCREAIEHSNSPKDKYRLMLTLASIYGKFDKQEEQSRIFKEIEVYAEKDADADDKFGLWTKLAEAAPDDEVQLSCYNEAEKWITQSTAPVDIIYHYFNKSIVSKSRYEKLLNLDKAIMTYDISHQQDSVMLGVIYRNKGHNYLEVMDYNNACNAYMTAIECFRNISDDRYMLMALSDLAYAAKMGDYQDFYIPAYEQLFSYWQDCLPDSHEEYHIAFGNLFFAYLDIDDTEKASALLKEYHRPDKDSEENVYNDLYFMQANLHIAKGEYRDALSCMDKIDQSLLFETCIDDWDELMIQIYRGLDDRKKMTLYTKQYARSVKEEIINSYYSLTRDERKTQSFYVNNVLDILMADADLGPEFANEAFEFSLFSKGLLFRTEKEFNKAIANDKTKYEEYVFLKDMYNQAVAEADSAKAAKLQEHIGWKERKLAHSLDNITLLKSKMLVGKEDVLDCLPSRALAIDFVRYNKDGFAYYGAFCINRNAPQPVFVELCKEQELYAMIQYNDSGDISPKSMSLLFDSKAGLHNLIWEPLAGELKGYKEIYFCGTGLLNTIPIEYATTEGDSPITDKFHRVFSLTDINHNVKMGKDVLVFGVADHNSPVKEIPSGMRGSFSNLPDVKIEIERLEDILGCDKKTTYYIKLDDAARESVLKGYTGSNISALHIASHAFYLSPEMMQSAAENAEDENHNAAIRFLKAGKPDCSAILLRGGNLRWHSPVVGEGEDDILTSDEVENLNFPNLNLVVLSACQTGIGQADIEGTWGLRRAFRIAGTKSLICTTRQVNSKYAAEFITALYKRLTAGKTIHTAFYDTIRTMQAKERDNFTLLSSFILIE